MIATIPYIKQRFDEYNAKMFGGRLPHLKIELSDAARFLGLFVCDVRRDSDGRRENYNFRLRINMRIDMRPDVLDDVIIHEMIHYFIALHNLVDTSAHGKIFRSIMESLNANHGRNIQVAHRNLTDEEREQAVSKRPTWHIIARLELTDGSTGVKVLPRVAEKVVGYVNAVKRAPNVRDIVLYLHNNPFFNRYPTSASLKYQPISSDIFDVNLSGARPIEIRGNKLYPKN